MNSIKGRLVDVYQRKIYPGEVIVRDGVILDIRPSDNVPDQFILPGFIDAHIHIESSMLVPYEFACIALRHGTVATVSDPHEIANVMGVEGVRYMLENAKDARLKFHFGAPSCVPATRFETAGASIDASAVQDLLQSDSIYFLSEMMNYPGVLFDDPEVLQKIEYARVAGKPIDGHAPGLKGKQAQKYISAGITTDHECYTLEEALDKLNFGMKIIIREGSAAKNYNALHPLIQSHPEKTMFCSDDKHPDDLMLGHINQLVVRSLEMGYNLFDILQIACINPVSHYNLKSGTLRKGEAADFIIVKDLQSFELIATYIDGSCVCEKDKALLPRKTHLVINHFEAAHTKADDFVINADKKLFPVIRAIDGELITEKLMTEMPVLNGAVKCDLTRDILKIVVVNRYQPARIAKGFIQNFGIKKGAIASTVAHDSHNIIAIGTEDEDISKAINLLIQSKGGLSLVSPNKELQLPLPIAGLMSDRSCHEVAAAYSEIDAAAKKMGSKLRAPFMTLSFMALLVIPKIKLSDLGMFDAESFQFYDLSDSGDQGS